MNCLTDTAEVPGDVIEVGCHQGRTSVFLNRHLDDLKSEKRYYALDTFEGFTERDLNHEINVRGKNSDLRSQFHDSKKQWFDAAMELNKANRVTSFKADAATFNYSQLGPSPSH